MSLQVVASMVIAIIYALMVLSASAKPGISYKPSSDHPRFLFCKCVDLIRAFLGTGFRKMAIWYGI